MTATTTDLTATEILRLARKDAALLFPGDERMVAQRYRRLAMLWHPDRNAAPEAAAVFAHVTELHDAIVKLLAGPGANEARFRTRDGRTFRLFWLTRHDTDVGTVFVGERHVAHVVRPEAEDLARVAADLRLPVANDGMRAQMEPLLPRRVALLDTDDGMVFVHAKDPDQVLLADLMKLGPVEVPHASWMVGKLLNLACWLQYAGLVHGAVGPDCLLVSPQHHTVALTGPMLCATRLGMAPEVLPERTLSELPRLAAGEVADIGVDPALVRLTIRELLGDPAGTRLAADPYFPKSFANWLLMPAADGAQADFAAWEQAREAAFGPRRFVKWDFDPAAVVAA